MSANIYYNFIQIKGAPLSFPINNAGEEWRKVRDRLESKYGLQTIGTRNKLPDSGYVAWIYQPNKTSQQYRNDTDGMLIDTYMVKPGQRFIIARLPRHDLPQFKHSRRLIQPDVLKQVHFTEDMSEEQKIGLLMDQVESSVKQHYPPPPDYICHRCGKHGHWKQDCLNRSHKPVFVEPKMPMGIPKTMLRQATEQEKANAMKTDTGEYVVAAENNELELNWDNGVGVIVEDDYDYYEN